MLLDQFGNYAVQCCLRLGDGNNQFIFDAMVEKLLNVAQGRFGARAMRGTLDNQHVTLNQKVSKGGGSVLSFLQGTDWYYFRSLLQPL